LGPTHAINLLFPLLAKSLEKPDKSTDDDTKKKRRRRRKDLRPLLLRVFGPILFACVL